MKNEKHVGTTISLILAFTLIVSSIVNGVFEQKQTIEQFSKQEQTNAATDNNVTNLQEKINNLEAKLQNIEAISNSTDANQNKTINDLYTQINNIKSEIQTIKSQISSLENKNTLQENEIKNLENRLTTIENKQPLIETVTLTQENFYHYMGVKISFSDLTTTENIILGSKMNFCNINFEFYPIVPNVKFDYAQITIELNTAFNNNLLYGCGTPNVDNNGGYYTWFVHDLQKEITVKIPTDGYFTVSMQIYQHSNKQNTLPCFFDNSLCKILPKGWVRITN